MAHSNHPSAGGSAESLQAGHELTDVKVGPLLQFGAMMAVVVAVTMWGVLKMHHGLEAYWASHEEPAHPMQSSGAAPAGPRLLVNEAKYYGDFKGELDGRIDGDSAYAWIDQPADVVRVPIARAMELVLKEGLPHRPADH